MKSVAFIGAGALGTALALVVARCGHRVFLITRDQKKALFMQENRFHPTLLQEHVFPQSLVPTADMDCIKDVRVTFLTVPSQEVRVVSKKLSCYLPDTLVVCSKGLEKDTDHFLLDVVKQENKASRVCMFSGPGFATEIASGKATVHVLAGTFSLSHVVALFAGSNIFMQTTHDFIGTQIGGVVKNIIAIGCGILEGTEMGSNAHAMLVTQGFREMFTLACALGAESSTLMGPAGLGDLVLTCSHRTSRNFNFGFQLGKDAHVQSSQYLVEGVHNASAIVKLLRKHHIKAPVCETVYAVLEKKIFPKEFFPRVLNILGT